MSVRVIARVRPLQKSEFDKDVVLQTSCANSESRPSVVRIPNPRNEGENFSFQFNSVYDSGATQQDIFDGEGGVAFDRYGDWELTTVSQLHQQSSISSMDSTLPFSHMASQAPARPTPCEAASHWQIVELSRGS
jgi:hypothetical protein